MKSGVTVLAGFSIWFMSLAWAPAEIPSMINYQGRLLQGTNLFSGQVGLALRLYNAPVGGRLLCTDSSLVTVVDGLYSTAIGDDSPPGALTMALTNDAVFIDGAGHLGTGIGGRRVVVDSNDEAVGAGNDSVAIAIGRLD